jgi:prevent-host-death family protein
MRSWQLQQAKAHLSQVVKEAMLNGPQEISLHGEPVVILISKAEYDKLVKPKPSFVEFMRKSPLAGVQISVSRDKSLTRKVDL